MNGDLPAAFRIHLAVDGSEHSLAATQLVRDLPLPANSKVTILGVLTPGRPPDESGLQAAIAQAETILEGSPVETSSRILQGNAAQKLIEYGTEHRPDLMLIGAKGLYSILNILLGGVAHQVVENARWPVLVMRTPYRGLQRVLFTTDGSPNSREAARYLAGFPLPEQTELQVLHVQPLYPSIQDPMSRTQPLTPSVPFMLSMMPSPTELKYVSRHADLAEQKGRTLLAETKKILQGAGLKVTTFLSKGDPASEIIKQDRKSVV